MQAFFSNTDVSELHDNAPLNQYYLSLIVNFDGKYCAKLAYVGEVTKQFKLKNPGDSEEYDSITEEMLILVDLEIVKEASLPSETFQKRYETLKEEKEAKKVFKPYQNTGTYYSGKFQNKNSKIVESTDLWEDTPWATNDIDREWDKEYEAYKRSAQRISKNGNEYPIVSSKSGLKISISDKEFNKYLVNWLEQGLEIFEGLHFDVIIKDIADGLKVFDDYFDRESDRDQLTYFISQMKKIAIEVFKEVHPTLVQTKGCLSMDRWDGIYNICVDLYEVFSSYSEYYQNETLIDG